MTPDQIRWLTWGAIQHRPSGSPKWDEPGTHKAITDHCVSWGLEVATEHVLAHARDAKARTPFAIKGPTPHTEPTKGAARPLKPAEACRTCGRAVHAPSAECDASVPVRTTDISEPISHLRGLLAPAPPPVTNLAARRGETDQPEEGE